VKGEGGAREEGREGKGKKREEPYRHFFHNFESS